MAEYNTELFLLKESIKSILSQTYGNFEFIIIDDCGKNNVEKIVKKIGDKRIKVLKNDKNKGLVYSLNKGIENAKGKYIARMDTDDYSYPNRFEIEVNFLESNSEYALVASNCDYYDEHGIWGSINGDSREITRRNLLKSGSIVHPTVMMRTDALKNIGGYLDYNRCEDYATWVELYFNGYKLYKIKDKLLNYHLSLDDYKKRKLSKRKGYFSFLKNQYKKLNPTLIDYSSQYLKTIIAGIVPHNILYNYHKKKLNK